MSDDAVASDFDSNDEPELDAMVVGERGLGFQHLRVFWQKRGSMCALLA